MSILVAYATRHGSTGEIAERIGGRLRASGLTADVRPVKAAGNLAGYDAFVVGSAAYLFHWLGEATRFVRRNRAALAAAPVWLFSSGPLGTEAVDDEGRDVFAVTEPREFAEFRSAIGPRGHRVFRGALDAHVKPKGFMERLVWMMPAARAAFPMGDFRDWPAIDAWADGIARELAPASAAGS